MLASLATYLSFPPDWSTGSGKDQYFRAAAQIRLPLRLGGFGFTAASMLTNVAFYAGFAKSLHWISHSTFRRFLNTDTLGVNTSGPFSHVLLKDLSISIDYLLTCNCVIMDPSSTQPDTGVKTLPTISLLCDESLQNNSIEIPAQRTLTQLVRELNWLAYGGRKADTDSKAQT